MKTAFVAVLVLALFAATAPVAFGCEDCPTVSTGRPNGTEATQGGFKRLSIDQVTSLVGQAHIVDVNPADMYAKYIVDSGGHADHCVAIQRHS